MRADLHLHTTASDGLLSPDALVRKAAEKGVSVIAVTDHDTLAGLDRAMREGETLGVTVLPGIEISAGGDQQIHVLGYGVDPKGKRLQAFHEHMRSERLRRLRGMAARLEEFGMPVPVEKIIEEAGNVVGRPHLARAMITLGYVETMQEAFDKWLDHGKPAYVPREKLSVGETAQMLLSEGGVPVLAHPSLLEMPDEIFLPLLNEWQKQGIMGIEVYHPANRGRFAFYEALARKNNLLVTGGSDYHDDQRGMIGETADDWTTAESDVQALLAAVRDIKKSKT